MAMTVGELREILKDVPDDLPIMTSVDPEGNGIWPLGEVEIDVHFCDGYTCEESELKDHEKDSPRVICLWPGYDWKNVRKE